MTDGNTGKPDTRKITASIEFAENLKIIADHHNITMPEALDRFSGEAIVRETKRVLSEKSKHLSKK